MGERLEPETGIVDFKGKKYFSVYHKASISGMNIFYFYPLKLITSPLGYVPIKETCIIFILLVIFSFLLAFMCDYVYKKHFKLLQDMKKEAFKGNFETNLINKVPVVELVQVSNIFHETIKTSAEHQDYDFDHTKDNTDEIYSTEVISILYIKIDSFSKENEDFENVFNQFDKIMKHYSCMSVSACGNIYMAACGMQKNTSDFTEKLLKAALTCISFIKKHTSLKCYAGFCTGEVKISDKSDNIWGKTVEEAFDLMLLSSAMKVTICKETLKKIERQCRYTPIGCNSYQVDKGIFDI